MNDPTPTWRTDQLENRVEQLERRLDDSQTQVSHRIFDVYSTIYWVLFILLIGLEIGVIVVAAAHR